jgi:ferredoxin
MLVTIDPDKCIAVGQVVLLDPHPAESERPAVLNAIARCPADVIALADE